MDYNNGQFIFFCLSFLTFKIGIKIVPTSSEYIKVIVLLHAKCLEQCLVYNEGFISNLPLSLLFFINKVIKYEEGKTSHSIHFVLQA